jgi:hypothetical protein
MATSQSDHRGDSAKENEVSAKTFEEIDRRTVAFVTGLAHELHLPAEDTAIWVLDVLNQRDWATA